MTTTFADGRAQVVVDQRFDSKSDKPAEVRYRIPLSRAAQVTALQVCNPVGCRRGRVARGSAPDAYDAAVHARGPENPSPPVARARIIRTRTGLALELHAAPVSKLLPLTTRVTFVTPAPLHAGMVRLSLPARGMDPRAAPGLYGLVTKGLLDPRIDGERVQPATETTAPARAREGATNERTGTWVERDPWLGVRLSARMPRGGPPRLSASHFNCPEGRKRCAHLRAAAGPRTHAPVDLILAIDASPSMEGAGRNRLTAAIAALLSAAPAGTRIRSLIFAGRAEVLTTDPQAPDRIGLAAFKRAAGAAELGSATRLASAITLARELWRKQRVRGPSGRPMKRLLVVIGDGGITIEGQARRTRDRRRPTTIDHGGVEMAIINLADRATLPALRALAVRSGGALVEAGPEAAEAVRGHHSGPLEEQLDAAFAPVVAARVTTVGTDAASLPALRAGHEVAWQGRIRGQRASLRVGGQRAASRRTADPAGPLGPLSPGVDQAADGWPSLLAVDGKDLAHQQTDWPMAPLVQPTRPNGRPKACDRRGPARRMSGQSSDERPIQLATPRRCRPKPAVARSSEPELGKGMPAGPLLEMLRQRIIPVARGCFRRDRAGRADHARRAVFKFRLSEREIVSARVEGEIPETLRGCLIQAVDGLLVPRFDGTVVVSYPLRTEREALPEQIELTSETAGAVDTLLSPKM